MASLVTGHTESETLYLNISGRGRILAIVQDDRYIITTITIDGSYVYRVTNGWLNIPFATSFKLHAGRDYPPAVILYELIS